MQIFIISLLAVAVLLVMAVPGFILIKKKMISEECIPGLSKILIFIAQPCLLVYTFSVTPYSPERLIDIGIFALICLGVNALMLGGAYLVLRKKQENPIYRIMTIATTFGNCAFFGIPVIEALFPEMAPNLLIYTTVYGQVMNIIGWTIGSAIISRNSEYISLKKIILSPVTISVIIALIIYIFQIPLVFTIGDGHRFAMLLDSVTFLGRMCTPLSMLIMGMRLATMSFRSMFTEPRVYITIAVKQLLMPLISLAILWFLPIDPWMKRTFFVISACPVASVVLNYAELVGEGQREAANMLLVGTMLSIITLPVMSLLLPLIV